MKVYITGTPNVPKKTIDEITTLLNSVNGEIKFIPIDPYTKEQLVFSNPKFQDLDQIGLLSAEELFKLGSTYRIMNPLIQMEDIVVVISQFTHSDYWFSATSMNNIFVDANGWEYITENDSIYGISYQIIENVFQSLIGIQYDNAIKHPNVHMHPIGCINDMCVEKKDVMLKLRSGYICNSCLQKAVERNVSQSKILQIHQLIQIIRDMLMNFDFLKQIIIPEQTIVDEKCNVVIGKYKFVEDALVRTLFIFYLIFLEGVKINSLDEKKYKDVLKFIYGKLQKRHYPKVIDNLCLPIQDNSSTFLKVKSVLNKNLINLLGKQLSEYYVILKKDESDIYKINLSPEYLELQLRVEEM